MAIATAPSISLEGLCGSTSYGVSSSWKRPSFEGRIGPHLAGTRCRVPLFGAAHFHWLPIGHELFPSKASVASDYSGSAPESSSYPENQGYHPLEELKVCKRIRDTKLTIPEIARTTVEANTSGLLVFPGTVHCEPHESISWAEYQYVIDDYGDIYFEIYDDENILQDRDANNPVNAFIGMDLPMHMNRRTFGEYNFSDIGSDDDIPFDDDYIVAEGTELFDSSADWGTPEDSSSVHPVFFSKCLKKAINMQHVKKMDHPSNGVSIMGYLRPTFVDEEPYLRTLFHSIDSGGFSPGWRDGDILSYSSNSDGKNSGSILYCLEIMQIQLFSVYGVQSLVNLQDFQDAEPDVLIYSTPAIVEQLKDNGINCNVALRGLCKKKGIHVEGAKLIGVDRLGIDVRVFAGVEVRTHRFPFKVQANSDGAAAKQIQQLLFPRSRRKKLRSHSELLEEDPYSY